MNEQDLRERMSMHGESLFNRGLAHGSSGNLSARLPDGMLITPTNSCLGRLDPGRISKVRWDGALVEGDKPSKEAFLHLAVYQSRPRQHGIVHLHSLYAVALSCLAHADSANVLPPITAYYVMQVGRLPLIPYFPPGDTALAEAVEMVARSSRSVLLANHGPVVAGDDLDKAVYAMEELEQTARLYFLLKDESPRFLSEAQCRQLGELFPS